MTDALLITRRYSSPDADRPVAGGKRLRYLGAADAGLTGLPDELGELVALEELRVHAERPLVSGSATAGPIRDERAALSRLF